MYGRLLWGLVAALLLTVPLCRGWSSEVQNRPNIEIVAQRGHFADANAVGFAPDERSILSGSDDQTLKLWELFDFYRQRNDPVVGTRR
jgi:WD40 repeat protein